jgi:cytochrome c oxidase subunit 1
VTEAAATLDPVERHHARRLTLMYLSVSTVVFFVTGLLGIWLRSSQSDLARVDDNTWYALMTAHGLGAFLGWAGFAVMGLAWWVLASVGFGPRGFGRQLGYATFWLMTIGLAGVIVTTVLMHFAASWVFLYPLPFESAGEWNDTTAGIFSASVLLVGGSILTWCVGILHTVVGPALHAVRPGILNRLGLALGFGYLWPKRFATNPSSVPYPVIPLTVISIDMIIATLPLAVMLVVMVIKSFAPSVEVDPLLAKNILWFFGHPVVYLLLFPAVAILYLLVPRLAGRALVAGNVVSVAWLVALIANVSIWAHHMYLDYPEGTFQAHLNTAHQPLTYLIVLPSALSLYSLFFTIYRSSWQWTAASTALFLALVSWFSAGLSGIVNATIGFDVVVHNTLWIVGHFHQMALLNVGLVVIGALYVFLPELLGRPLWSEALGKWHVWLTFAGGSVNSALWLYQGLEGTPRRFSVLPEGFPEYRAAALTAVGVIAFAQVLFAVNLVQTIRGAERRESRGAPVAEALLVIGAVALILPAALAGYVIGRETAPEGGGGAAAATTETGGEEHPGAAVFAEAGCGTCHTFGPAGSTGTIGPSLDETQLSAAQIAQVVSEGRGAMPAFGDRLTRQQITDVAAYVAEGG